MPAAAIIARARRIGAQSRRHERLGHRAASELLPRPRAARTQMSSCAGVPCACAPIQAAALNASTCAARCARALPTSQPSFSSRAPRLAALRQAPVDLARHQQAGRPPAARLAHPMQHRERLRGRMQIDRRRRHRHDQQVGDPQRRLETLRPSAAAGRSRSGRIVVPPRAHLGLPRLAAGRLGERSRHDLERARHALGLAVLQPGGGRALRVRIDQRHRLASRPDGRRG